MYLQSKIDGDALGSTAQLPRPFGPAFTRSQVEQCDSMEVWCSGIMDSGPDCTRYDLKRGSRVIASVVVPGY